MHEPTTDGRNWSQGKTKNVFQVLQKFRAITIVPKPFPVQQIAWKPSRLFWRRGTLRNTFPVNSGSLSSEIGSETPSKVNVFSRENFGQLRLLVWKNLPNRKIWILLLFSGELAHCVTLFRTGSCRLHIRTGKWIGLHLAPPRSLIVGHVRD